MGDSPLEQFLFQRFHVDNLYDIQWYPTEAVRTSETGHVLSVQMDMPLQPGCTIGQVPLDNSPAFPTPAGPIPAVFQPKLKRAYRERPVDLNKTVVQSVLIKGYNNPNECPVGLKTNVMPKALQHMMHVYDQTKAAAQGHKEWAGLRMDLPPETSVEHLEGNQVTYLMREHPDLPKQKPAWALPMGLINKSNIDNFAIEIPRDVCIAQTNWAQERIADPNKRKKSELNVWIQSNGPDGKPLEPLPTSIHHWYALPPDHILATLCYAPKPILEQQYLECHFIRTRKGNAPMRGFVLVTDITYRGLRQFVLEQWLPCRDMRSLLNVSVDAVSLDPQKSLTKPVMVKTSVTYLAWSAFTPEEIAQMMPTCNANLVIWHYRNVYKDVKQKRFIKTLLPNK